MSNTVLVLAAHPDDAELSCSGTIRILANEGRPVVLIDSTRGELGTRGTPELREQEATAASRILGVTARECLDLPDGNIEHTQANILRVVESIRAWKPSLMLIPPPFERHPDHEAVHRIARSAAFLSGLTRIITVRGGVEQEPHRPKRMLCYEQSYSLPKAPDVYVDISSTFAAKMESIRAFSSQFHVPEKYSGSDPGTYLSRPEFLDEIEARALHYGSRIGVRYAEAFMAIEPVGVASLSDLL